MSASYFLDTNVLVYSFDEKQPTKRDVSRALIATALRDGSGVISYQVVQEFLNVALQGFESPMSLEQCRDYLSEVLMPLCAVFPDSRLYSKALDVRGATGFSFYDSAIVASAAIGGCSRLLTEDMQDGREVEGVRIENPFT
jgi:predicted nucleic acid-binding protein